VAIGRDFTAAGSLDEPELGEGFDVEGLMANLGVCGHEPDAALPITNHSKSPVNTDIRKTLDQNLPFLRSSCRSDLTDFKLLSRTSATLNPVLVFWVLAVPITATLRFSCDGCLSVTTTFALDVVMAGWAEGRALSTPRLSAGLAMGTGILMPEFVPVVAMGNAAAAKMGSEAAPTGIL